jgi:hypothetical protein
MNINPLTTADAKDKRTHMARPNNSAIPVAHHDIVRVLEPVGARAIADPFLALLELFEQAEVAGDYGEYPSAMNADIRTEYTRDAPFAMID